MKLKPGQYVRHPKFGWGTILDDDGRKTLVYFRNIGIRRLGTSQSVFTLVGGEADKKKTAA